MTAADAQAVAALDAALFGSHAWSLQAWQRQLVADDPDTCYLVLLAPEMIGYAGLLRTGSDADVLTVAVAEAHQRQGHGRALVASLLAVARQWRCLAVFLEVEEGNTAAHALYTGMGFVAVGARRHYYGPDRHGVTMRLQVREPQGSLPVEGTQP